MPGAGRSVSLQGISSRIVWDFEIRSIYLYIRIRSKPSAEAASTMKTGVKIAALLLVTLAMASCGDSDGGNGKKEMKTGSWMLTSWNNSTELAGKVYLQLNDDNSFELYQSVDTPGFETFTGTYRISDDVLSGKYSTGELWESTYLIRIYTERELVLESKTDGAISVYRMSGIPDYVRQANPGVRSAASTPFL